MLDAIATTGTLLIALWRNVSIEFVQFWVNTSPVRILSAFLEFLNSRGKAEVRFKDQDEVEKRILARNTLGCSKYI